jgi:pimeloyl-ACP methyl ester carboxylesterase
MIVKDGMQVNPAQPMGQNLVSRQHLAGDILVQEVVRGEGAICSSPLLLVHGGMHDWRTWQRWLPYFAGAGWRTLALRTAVLRPASSSHLPASDGLLALRAVHRRRAGEAGPR